KMYIKKKRNCKKQQNKCEDRNHVKRKDRKSIKRKRISIEKKGVFEGKKKKKKIINKSDKKKKSEKKERGFF
ncbi:hypothetical protein, partial [Klebsiella pneumoniae]|uniref:hypothetical protein n=1 Tax=Klebsiella pneumoniae TaxID=573 RepID=UPI003F612250